MSQDRSDKPEQASKPIDTSRRRLAKAALAAPVLMSIPGRQVFAGTCTFSGDLSGNVSGAAGNCGPGGTWIYGRSPGYWKNHTGLLDPQAEKFVDHFGSTKFGNLTFLQVIELAEGACAGGGSPPYAAYCGLSEAERQLARHAVAAYLNAYESENGGLVVDPGYYFSVSQVVGLYLTVEYGSGNYEVNPGQWIMVDQTSVIDLYAQTFV